MDLYLLKIYLKTCCEGLYTDREPFTCHQKNSDPQSDYQSCTLTKWNSPNDTLFDQEKKDARNDHLNALD